MNKGIIDLIPAAVEAVKQETIAKMELFSSTGKAPFSTGGGITPDIDKLVEIVAAEVRRQMNK